MGEDERGPRVALGEALEEVAERAGTVRGENRENGVETAKDTRDGDQQPPYVGCYEISARRQFRPGENKATLVFD